MRALFQDLRYSFRGLARNPAFAGVVIMLLAVGIGANTLIFTAVDVLLLRPLQIPELDRVVNVIGTVPGFRLSTTSVSSGDFLDFRRSARTLEHFAALSTSSFLGESTSIIEQARACIIFAIMLTMSWSISSRYLPDAMTWPTCARVVIWSDRRVVS